MAPRADNVLVSRSSLLTRARALSCCVMAVLVWGAGCLPRHAAERRRPAERVAAPREFTNALDTYVALRKQAQAEVRTPEPSEDPTRVVARQRALAAAIRRLRAGARQGDVFTTATAA